MNVLSIDFDIVMAPDINLYNDIINCQGNQVTIEKLIESHYFLSGLRVDFEHYKKLTLYLLEVIKSLKPEDIRISYNHEDIKYLLKDLSNVNVINIDHHHDLGYDSDEDLRGCKECSCANWAKYFLDRKNIATYTWIKNTNSNEKKDMFLQSWSKNLYERELININSLEEFLPKIDKLFICLSPEWVPEWYHSLFYLWVDYFNKYYNTYFTIY